LLGGVAMSTTIEINEDLIRQIGQIPLMLRNAPFGRCLGAFAKPIAAACQGHAQSSRATGSRLKWSKKFKNNAAFQNDSRQHFNHKVFKGGIGVVIGATWKEGNKQQFVMPYKKGESLDRLLFIRADLVGNTLESTDRKRPSRHSPKSNAHPCGPIAKPRARPKRLF
jgi:hypothetical protein